MEAHGDFLHRLRDHVPQLHLTPREATGTRRLAGVGLAAGIGGGLMLAAPLVIWGWVRESHSALEYPMAVTGWLFGLEYFGQNEYRWWPIVIGALFLLAFWAVLGLAFAGLAGRVYRVRTLPGSLALGGVWSFVSFMFVWYMVLPIARDGAPFRLTAAGEYVAPTWVWVLGFTLAGFTTGIGYRALRSRSAAQPAASATEREQRAA